jgi:hypothetical protein
MIWDRLRNLGLREKLGLAVAGLFVFGLLLDRLVISPIVRNYVELGREIRKESKALSMKRWIAGTEPTVRESYQAVSGRLGRFTSQAQAIDAMKGQIDELAARTGVVLVSREHRHPREERFYQEYYVEIGEFEAGITNLVRFLHALPNAPGILRVRHLNTVPDRKRRILKGSMLISKVMLPAPLTGSHP